MALLALAASALAADPSGTDRPTVAATVHRDARELSDSVRHSSQQVGQAVTHDVHQFRHEFTVQWHQAGSAIHQWWINTRDAVGRI
jgi:hypothetical protein